jgi:hypothetical protein
MRDVVIPFLPFIGFTLDFVGKLLLAVAVLRVHHRFIHHKKLDSFVAEEIKKERTIEFIGLACIVLGYLAQVPSRLGM